MTAPTLAGVLGASLGLLLLASLPATAEYYEGKPECPPDHMCTMSAEEGEFEEDPNAPTSDTCMDGAQEGEVCSDDVVYLDGTVTSHAPDSNDGGEGREVATNANAAAVAGQEALALIGVAFLVGSVALIGPARRS